MKKTVIKRRKRIVPANYLPGSTPPHSSRHGGPPSNSSNSPSPPPNHLTRSPPSNSYGPLPPPWASQHNLTSTRNSHSYSPEPQDFTNYRPFACSPTFPSSYNEQNTLPPIRLPVGQNLQSIPSHQPPSIQHVGGAIPLPKRKLEDVDQASKRLRSIGPLLNPGNTVDEPDPLEGARVLLSLGSRESVIRKRAELTGEIEILGEKLTKLKKAIAECDDFLGKA